MGSSISDRHRPVNFAYVSIAIGKSEKKPISVIASANFPLRPCDFNIFQLEVKSFQQAFIIAVDGRNDANPSGIFNEIRF